MKTLKALLAVGAVLVVGACNLSEDEVRERAGDAAVATKRATDKAGETAREAYNNAAEKGKELAAKAGETYNDATLKAKVLAGFKLVKGLDSSDIAVEARDGVVHLTGTVPTQMDKMKAEGVAFGVTGEGSKVKSELRVGSNVASTP